MVAFPVQRHLRTWGGEESGEQRVASEGWQMGCKVEAVGGGSRDVEVTGRPTPEVKKLERALDK